MLPDSYRDIAAGRRGRTDLDARAIWKSGSEQGVLAADALVRRSGDLPRQSPKDRIIELRIVVSLPGAGFQPDFTRPVYVQIGNIAAAQRLFKRREEGAEKHQRLGSHRRAGPTALKSRSRATKISTTSPCLVVIVGGMSFPRDA